MPAFIVGGLRKRPDRKSITTKKMIIPMNPVDSNSLAYYISAHGYGHGVRSCDIIQALNTLFPRLRVHVVTDLPEAFLRNRIPSPANSFRPGRFDVGMVQLDSIRVDVEATLRQIESVYSRRAEIIEQEASFLGNQGISLVVADIPALPLEAACRAGIPGIAVSNFGWDWIYSAFIPRDRRWHRIADQIRAGYEQAELLLRLPFAEEMRAFRRIEDLPVVATPGRERRAEIAAATGAHPDRPWVLMSFTSLEWDESALNRIARLDRYEFFTVLPLVWHTANIHAVDREKIPFSDIVASVDAVISKPGFGIVSECLVNDKPLIYADRKDFLEYAVLEEAIHAYLRYVHIPVDQLYQGNLAGALELLPSLPPALQKIATGGAEVAARRMIQFL